MSICQRKVHIVTERRGRKRGRNRIRMLGILREKKTERIKIIRLDKARTSKNKI